MDPEVQQKLTEMLGNYSWIAIVGLVLLLFRKTIETAIAGLMLFIGNDYNEDDVVELDGKPGRIIRVGVWKTVFFVYHIVEGNIVSGDKLVVQNDKLKDLKISKPLPELDLKKYQNGRTWKRRHTDDRKK